jgi:hypothetical protein
MLTVTLFGHHDAIDQAISEELGRRGCRTHSVSVESGWLPSTTNAVVRLDTAAGASALEDLMAARRPGVHIVAISEESGESADRLRHLCEECGSTHEVSLLRLLPVQKSPESGRPEVDPPLRHLALAVVDAVADQTRRSATPSFSTWAVAV